MADRFDRARRRAYAALEALLRPLEADIRVGMIGLRALQAWDATWPKVPEASHRYGGWPWDKLVQEYHFPSRFDVAIWAGADLCALAIGDGPSSGLEHVRWNWVEGWRTPNPLTDRVIQSCDFCVCAYAVELGVRIVQVDCPAPGLDDIWDELRYGPLTRPGNYLRPFREKAIYTI
jgi:hypothetical protein